MQSQLTSDFKYVINSDNLKLLSNVSCRDLDQNAFAGESNSSIDSQEVNKISHQF